MKITILPDGQLRYTYKAVKHDPTCLMCFSTYNEVGAPYQADARKQINKLLDQGYEIQFGVELDAPPWVADKATRTVKEKKS